MDSRIEQLRDSVIELTEELRSLNKRVDALCKAVDDEFMRLHEIEYAELRHAYNNRN